MSCTAWKPGQYQSKPITDWSPSHPGLVLLGLCRVRNIFPKMNEWMKINESNNNNSFFFKNQIKGAHRALGAEGDRCSPSPHILTCLILLQSVSVFLDTKKSTKQIKWLCVCVFVCLYKCLWRRPICMLASQTLQVPQRVSVWLYQTWTDELDRVQWRHWRSILHNHNTVLPPAWTSEGKLFSWAPAIWVCPLWRTWVFILNLKTCIFCYVETYTTRGIQ